MQHAHLGRSGLRVSRIGLGTMNFGDVTEEPDAFRIMDTAVERGVTFFDTADIYGQPDRKGRSEEVIGRWLRASGKRDEIVLATKVFEPMGEGPNDRGLSAFHIRRACEASLRRLQTDHIDLYQLHHVDRSTPMDELWQAMDQLVREGKITYVGSSNFAGWQIAVAQSNATARHSLGLISEQSVYNLANRAIEQELVPALEHFGIGLIPWSPLSDGLLAGRPKGAATGRRAALRERFAMHAEQLDDFERLCRELGHDPATVALAWLLHRPVVSSVIAGSRTVEQLLSSMRALDVALDGEALAELDRIWPGPGEAPESYAW